jgi:hypothetical protein
MKKRTAVGFCLSVAAVVGLALMVYKALAGSLESGTVHNCREVPVVGPHLDILDANGPIRYIRHRMYIRPHSAILVAGQCPANNFKAFFPQRIQPFQEQDIRAWTHILDTMGAEPRDFSVGQPGQDLTGYTAVWTADEELIVRGLFRAERSSFMLYVIQVRHVNRGPS